MSVKKLDLKEITLVAIGSTRIKETLAAINICTKYAKFKDIVYFSDKHNPYQYPIKEMRSIKDYDSFVVYELPSMEFSSDFILTIHWDGFIVNPKAWTSQFLEYDYIGAPWPHINDLVGNGGFCLKSQKFLKTQQKIVKNIAPLNDPDDLFLSYKLRSDFIHFGCKYGDDIGFRFATEHGGYHYHNSFGFHDFKPNPQFKPLLYQTEGIEI